MENGTVELTSEMIDETRGGTFLKSSRVNIRKKENGIERVLERLEELKIGALIVIGGEDTLSNALLLDGIPQILISKTIDNDVGRIENQDTSAYDIINYFTLGFPTALRKIKSFVSVEEGVRTTAYSHERIIVVESMGMHTGWLALASCLGEPDFIIIPEFPLQYERFLSSVIDRYSERKNLVVTVAEGARWEDGSYISGDDSEKDEFDHPRFMGSAQTLCSRLKEDLTQHLDTRNVNFVNPSYLYRSGAPCDLDLMWGKELGRKAVEVINDGLNETVLLSIQRENGDFCLESFHLNNINKIDDIHRFVTESFYNSSTFSATDLAEDYFRLFV